MSDLTRPTSSRPTLRHMLSGAANGIVVCGVLLAWLLFGLGYYLDRMNRDIALIGVGAAFLSAGMLLDWAQRQGWQRHFDATQEAAEETDPNNALDVTSDQWDRAYIIGAHDLRRRIATYTFRLAVCFVIVGILPLPLQPMGLAFGLALLLLYFIRVARFSAMRATERTVRQLLKIKSPPANSPE
jgi:hypothetical protein